MGSFNVNAGLSKGSVAIEQELADSDLAIKVKEVTKKLKEKKWKKNDRGF